MSEFWHQQTQRRIEGITKRLEKQLGLHWLTIRHNFDKEGEAEAKTLCSWEYRQATVTWSLSHACSMTDDELELTAIHEYAHLLIAPVACLVPEDPPIHTKLEEFAVENIARAIRRALAH